MDQADVPGDTIGYINFAPFLIGTPVVDTYQFKLAVAGVDHTNDRAKRKVRVCRREGFAVEALAIGGFAPIEPGAIPTGITHPGLDPLQGMIQMRYKGCCRAPSNPARAAHPPQRSPAQNS